MNKVLILKLGQKPGDPTDLLVVDAGQILDRVRLEFPLETSLADAVSEAQSIIAILPGECAAMRAVAAPPASKAKFRAAAGYLLEDDLAEPLDILSVVTHLHESGAGLILAVKRALLTDWIDILTENGLSPDIITVDYALLPISMEQATLFDEGGRVFGAIGLKGFAAEASLADELLTSLLDTDELMKVTYYSKTPKAFGTISVEHKDVEIDGYLKSFIGDTNRSKSLPNFRQGEFKPKRDWSAYSGGWQRAAALFAFCVLASLLQFAGNSWRDYRLADGLDDAAREIHLTAFPDAADQSPRAHARSVLSGNRSLPTFLPLTSQFAQAVDGDEGIIIERIRFNSSRGEYSVNLRFSDISDLEALKEALRANGITARETGSVRRTGETFIGELTVALS